MSKNSQKTLYQHVTDWTEFFKHWGRKSEKMFNPKKFKKYAGPRRKR